MSGPMTVGTGAMNQYGSLAQKHWRTWLPQRYSTIPDPASFFSQLGTEVSDRIASVELDLLEPDDRPRSTSPGWGGAGWRGCRRRNWS